MDYAWKSWSGQLPFISNCLAHHKGSIERIESIAQDLIEFQKQIDFHWQPVSELERIPICSGTIETGSSACAVSNEKEYGNNQDSKKNLFERCTIRKLLENIKTSFLSEVGKLQMTFEKLKLSIEVTTDTLNPDSKREEVNKTYRSYLEQYIEEILGQLNDRKRENADLKDEIMELSKKADKLEAEEVTLKREIENLEKENDTQKLEITNQIIMGGWQSSTKPDEQQLNYTLSSLSHQKDCIEGLVKYIEEQQAQFNVFSQTSESQVPGVESEALEYGDVDGNPEEPLNPLERNKRTLVKANLSSLQWHVRVVQTSFSTLQKTILDLAHQFATGQRRDELHAARSHIDKIHNLQLRVEGLEKHIETHRNEISIQTKESEHLRNKNEELIEQITNLESRNAELETNESSHKKEMESLKQLLQDRDNTRPVQLFYQSRGDTMSKVVDGLKTLLVNKLEMERNKIQFIDCQSEQDVNPEIPLFILCINTSRLGTDAGSALQKLKGCVSSNVSILICHHKDVHALPSQSSERVLTGPDFKELGGIFDLAFLSEKGIYPCDMNNNTACGIVEFLKPKD